MMDEKRHRTFLLIAIVYLFFNSIGLPEGLQYTTLMAPVLLLFLLNGKGIRTYLAFLLVTGLWSVFHFYTGVSFEGSYLKSFLMLQSVAVFTIATYHALPRHLEQAATFKVLATVNLVLLGLCLVLRFIPSLSGWVWYTVPISPGVPVVPRLKMFTYEASYYSLLITPLIGYYLLRCWLRGSRPGLLFASLMLSLLLSFSLGVIAGIALGLVLICLVHLDTLRRFIPAKYVVIGIVGVLVLAVGLYLFYPDNPLYLRLHNIWAGKDTSAHGRTDDAFSIAWHIANMKSIYWGIGPGQLKGLGRDYIIQFYHYVHIPETVRIPNAVAETLNIYGITGLALRFGLIAYLFFKTKVWRNYYRLFLFFFIFIYQFTGSFISNVAEYVIWAIAFCPGILQEFDVPSKKQMLL